MKLTPILRVACLVKLVGASVVLAASGVSWVPDGLPSAPESGPALCPSHFLKPEQGKAVLDAALARFSDRGSWEAYVQHARERIQQGAGLTPWPKRTPLNAIIRDRRAHDGYTVENVAFESIPGFFVTGNLYRPLNAKPPFAAMLSTHGHSRRVETNADYARHARFNHAMQSRCATLARMGAVVLSIDMVGYGDSIQLVGQYIHRQPFVQTLQVWNTIRAVDLLESLEGVDPKRIGVSGESGGGTQTFLLAALDPRIALSAPVVMVSSYFFGGCPCESGRPIHRSSDHFVNNAMIASFAAPRPLLVVSDGQDWTKHVPEIEFPFLQKIYGYFGAERNVANTHLPDEGHDYGSSKRAALYRFVAQHFGLDLSAAQNADGKIDESRVTIERPPQMRVFTAEFAIPHYALHDLTLTERKLRELQR